MDYEHVIMLPLPGSEIHYELCVCHRPEEIAAVVRALLDASAQPPAELRVITRPLIDRR